MNASSVPAQDKCDDSCSCNDGEVVCDKKLCLQPTVAPNMVCEEFFIDGECCPSHNCVNQEEESDLESESHMITTLPPDETEDEMLKETTTMEPEETDGEEIVTEEK